MTSDTWTPPRSGVSLPEGRLATCEFEASCMRAVKTTLDVRRKHDRIVTEIASTVDGADPLADAVRASQMAMVITDPLHDGNLLVFA